MYGQWHLDLEFVKLKTFIKELNPISERATGLLLEEMILYKNILSTEPDMKYIYIGFLSFF